jgi:hypothetical protein
MHYHNLDPSFVVGAITNSKHFFVEKVSSVENGNRYFSIHYGQVKFTNNLGVSVGWTIFEQNSSENSQTSKRQGVVFLVDHMCPRS